MNILTPTELEHLWPILLRYIEGCTYKTFKGDLARVTASGQTRLTIGPKQIEVETPHAYLSIDRMA